MAAREALDTQADQITALVGNACTQVSLGVAEALIIDFGELAPNPAGDLAGVLVLAIGCPWRIDGSELPIIGWEDDEEDVARQATALIGATVETVDLRRPGFDLTVQFSNAYRLRVFPDCRAYYSDEMSGGALPWQLAGRGLASSTPHETPESADES